MLTEKFIEGYSMNTTLHLYEIDPNRRYWVVRSGRGGEYIDHFRKFGVGV